MAIEFVFAEGSLKSHFLRFKCSKQHTTALSGQRPISDNGLLCTTAYYGKWPIVYNGLFRTTAFFVQRRPKTGHRPFSYNGLKNVGQRPLKTSQRPFMYNGPKKFVFGGRCTKRAVVRNRPLYTIGRCPLYAAPPNFI